MFCCSRPLRSRGKPIAIITPASTNTNIISMRLNPLRPMCPPFDRPYLHVPCLHVSASTADTYVAIAPRKPPQNTAVMQVFASPGCLGDPVTVDLVKQRAQAHAEQQGGGPAPQCPRGGLGAAAPRSRRR